MLEVTDEGRAKVARLEFAIQIGVIMVIWKQVKLQHFDALLPEPESELAPSRCSPWVNFSAVWTALQKWCSRQWWKRRQWIVKL
jgi:hypothetical protein